MVTPLPDSAGRLPTCLESPPAVIRASLTTRKALRGLRRRSRRQRSSGGWSLICGPAKAQNREEDDWQQEQTNAKASASSETLCQVDANNYPDDEIYERNEHEKQPPTGSARGLDDKVSIQNWNDRCPPWLSSFGENFPERCDHKDRERQRKDPEEWAGRLALRRVRVEIFDLC